MSDVLCKVTCSTMLAKQCVTPEAFVAGAVAPSVTIAKLQCTNLPGVLHTVQLVASEEPKELWLSRAPVVAKPKVDEEAAAIFAGFEALDPKPKRPRNASSSGDRSASGSGLAADRGHARDGVVPPVDAVQPGVDEDEFVRSGAASDEEGDAGPFHDVDLDGCMIH